MGKPSKYREWILTGFMRQYVIDKVKKPLKKAIVELGRGGSWLGMFIALIQIIRIAKRYPKPTRENCLHSNTHRLFDIRDKFFEYNDGQKPLWEAAFKLLIAEYEHDPHYQSRFDWMLEEIAKSGWEPRLTRPMSHWKEPGMAGISRVLPLTPEAWAKVVHTEEPYRSMLLRDIIYPVEERVKVGVLE